MKDNKKVCIATVSVFSSNNCGSFLQAYCLKKTIEKRYGVQAFFLDVHRRLKFSKVIRECLYNIKHRNFHAFLIRYNAYFLYRKLYNREKYKTIELINRNPDEYRIILGSDEIWNVNDQYTFSVPYLFGMGFMSKEISSYATSMNTAELKDFQKSEQGKSYLESIAKIGHISVRDFHTKFEIEQIPNVKATLVLDPTFFCFSNNSKFSNHEKTKYIFLYCFWNFTDEFIDELKRFAEKNNLLIIGANKRQNPMQKHVGNSPKLFLSYMRNADYIITDTFHGAAFSIIFNKNFVYMPSAKRKVHELIGIFHLENRKYADGNLSDSFAKTIDYAEVNDIIEKEKNNSFDFLDSVFK